MIAAVKSFSQVTLSGTVVDNKRIPVAAGDIFLLSPADSSIIKFAIIKDGRFSFDPVKKGEYLLKVSCVGLKVSVQPVVLEMDTSLAIALEENVGVLAGVTVTANRRAFVNENGNLRVRIDGSVLSSIPNTVDLLSKLPKVRTSADGESISVVGKGEALVYIDHQRATVNELNALPVREIKDIEIINNPPAKYEANGRVVILVTRKLSKREGLYAELSEAASFRRRYSNRLGLNVNYKRKKLELKTSFQYNRRQTWEANSFDFNIDNQNIRSGYQLTNVILTSEYTGTVGVHYQLNEEDYLSVSTTARIQRRSFPIFTNSYLEESATESNLFTLNDSRYPTSFYTTNINYRKAFKNNSELFVGGQYSTYDEKFASKIYNNANNTQTVFSQNREQRYGVDVVTGKFDFEKHFRNGSSWSIGGNISNAKANAILDIADFDPPGNFFSNYDYSEKIYSAYTQMAGQVDKAEYSAGLRMENTGVKGGYKNSSNSIIDSSYTNFFPKLHIEIPVDSTSKLLLNYARSIARPNYSKVSQVTNYINPYFEWASNIGLRPTITDEVSASFQFKSYAIGMTYFKMKGPVYANFVYDPQIIKLTRTDLNYKKENGVSVDLTIPVNYKIWTSQNQLYGIYSKVTDPAAVVGKAKPYLYFYSGNQFKLPKNTAVSLSGWWITKRNDGIFERNAMYSVDVNFTKTFKNGLSCAVGVNDIFQSMNTREKFTVNGVGASGLYRDGARELLLVVRYSFGTIKDSKYKSKDVDESINRIQ
jgi:hypothetical protein